MKLAVINQDKIAAKIRPNANFIDIVAKSNNNL